MGERCTIVNCGQPATRRIQVAVEREWDDPAAPWAQVFTVTLCDEHAASLRASLGEWTIVKDAKMRLAA